MLYVKLSRLLAIGCLLLFSHALVGQEKSLFNGKDLSGWDGNPELWSVRDSVITGVTKADEPLPYNQFLIWRGGVVKNFELRMMVRQSGNNSGVQYRSKELPDVGKWSVGGYQCDIHPVAANNAMLYDERGRGIVAANGEQIIVDASGDKWVAKKDAPVEVNVADWNEYKIIARGNHLIHQVNGKTTVDIVDHQESERELVGLVAFQVHRGPAMKVEIKDIFLKELPDGDLITLEQHPIPKDAIKKAGPQAKKNAPKNTTAVAPTPNAPPEAKEPTVNAAKKENQEKKANDNSKPRSGKSTEVGPVVNENN